MQLIGLTQNLLDAHAAIISLERVVNPDTPHIRVLRHNQQKNDSASRRRDRMLPAKRCVFAGISQDNQILTSS
jgi:hypothetical protein